MRPTRDENLWELCDVVAKRGTCSRLQVGAVASRDGRILLSGYNGAPAGMPHCNHTGEVSITLDEKAHKELYGTHGKPPDSGCKVSVHAEANLIAWAARHGVRLDGARLDCTDSPCLPCAQLIINAGFIEVCFHRRYRDHTGEDLLIQAEINVHSRSYGV